MIKSPHNGDAIARAFVCMLRHTRRSEFSVLYLALAVEACNAPLSLSGGIAEPAPRVPEFKAVCQSVSENA